MKISYMSLFLQALKYTWRNKSLWVFGIFAALFNTIYFVSFIDQQATLKKLQSTWQFFSVEIPDFVTVVMALGPLAIILTIMLVIALVSIGLGFLWLNLIGQATIINNISNLENQKKLPTIRENFKIKKDLLGRIFGLIAATQIIVVILSVAMSLPKFAATWFSISGSSIFGNIFMTIIGTIFISLSVFVFFTALFALNYLVIKKLPLKESVEKAIQLFSKNWIISLEAVILIICISYLVTYLSVHIFNIYVVLIAILKGGVTSTFGGFMLKTFDWIAKLGFALFIGLVTTYQLSLWTVLFERLTKQEYKGLVQTLIGKFKKTS